jgi:hypothetical protein
MNDELGMMNAGRAGAIFSGFFHHSSFIIHHF